MPRWLLVIALLLTAGGKPAAAEDLERIEAVMPRHYVCQRTAAALRIDGRLDESSWQQAAWTEAFVDIEGADRPAPRFLTRAKLLWDDTCLYVGAELEEPGVWGRLTHRDAIIYQDNDFEVFIDPDGDTHQYYEFEINALGTEWDLFLVQPYRDGGPYLSAWDIAGLRTAVHVRGTVNDPRDQDEGWSVEMAFPWAVLRECAGRQSVPPVAGDQWRVNFSRVQWQTTVSDSGYTKVPGRPEDNWVWSPQGLINMHYPEQWGFVQFATEPVGQPAPPFVLAPGLEAQRLLRAIYYRQHRFRRQHGRYTASLDTLGLAPRPLRHHLWPPVVAVTPRGFEAAVTELAGEGASGPAPQWVIRQDSRIWRE